MPYKWTEPEVAFTLEDGTRIFHTYENDVVNQFWYTTSPDEDFEEYHFDVRDIASAFKKAKPPTLHLSPDSVEYIEWGIENGLIKTPDDANDSTFYFNVILSGRGTNPDDAWRDATEQFGNDPGPYPEDFTREYDD